MHSNDADAVNPAKTTIIRIKDRGVIGELEYDGAISAHAGSTVEEVGHAGSSTGCKIQSHRGQSLGQSV